MSEHKPARRYERISADLILDPQLTEADAGVLFALEMKAGESRRAKVTPAWLAERVGCHRATVYRALQKGMQLGYIAGQEQDDQGRLWVQLRPTAPSWCYAPRDFLESDRPFWQKHALLIILA